MTCNTTTAAAAAAECWNVAINIMLSNQKINISLQLEIPTDQSLMFAFTFERIMFNK